MRRGNHRTTRHGTGRSKRSLIIAAIVIVGLFVVASGVWTLVRPGKADPQDTQAAVAKAKLSEEEKTYRKQLTTKLTFVYGTNSTQPTSTDIAAWYGTTRQLDRVKIVAYIQNLGTTLGIQVKNTDAAADSTLAALQSNKDTTVTLEKQIVALKNFTYCTNVRNVDPSNLPALRAKLQSTYADPRGWGLGGLVAFHEGTSGCDFTVWLSSNDQMTSFGGVCDVTWSCRSGDNVVLNFDRWSGASDSWNAAGGSLDEYRSMLINHETGHRLGFSHRQCTGAGNPAPVMQQQSISLNGCTFNAWPSAAELATLHQILGI